MLHDAFTLSPQKWIDSTNAIGIVSRSGRFGGTFAHSDIAFEFASWISAEFKLYIIKDYKRLKNDVSSRLSLGWNLNKACLNQKGFNYLNQLAIRQLKAIREIGTDVIRKLESKEGR